MCGENELLWSLGLLLVGIEGGIAVHAPAAAAAAAAAAVAAVAAGPQEVPHTRTCSGVSY
jgi:Flp pilus assembly protein TadG